MRLCASLPLRCAGAADCHGRGQSEGESESDSCQLFSRVDELPDLMRVFALEFAIAAFDVAGGPFETPGHQIRDERDLLLEVISYGVWDE